LDAGASIVFEGTFIPQDSIFFQGTLPSAQGFYILYNQ
jgi:hypothetical protein